MELTGCERRTAQDLIDGLTIEQVATRLWVTTETVKFHRTNVYRKLGLTGSISPNLNRSEKAEIVRAAMSENPRKGDTAGAGLRDT